jgi:hypothetical protein
MKLRTKPIILNSFLEDVRLDITKFEGGEFSPV